VSGTVASERFDAERYGAGFFIGSPVSASAAVWAGDDLQEMPAGIFPIDAASAVVRVELTRPALAGVSPIRQVSASDSVEDLVELGFTDQESVVLRVGRAVVVGVVEGHVVVHLHDQERTVRRRLRKAQNLGEECR
jgi:hypothetical protein